MRSSFYFWPFFRPFFSTLLAFFWPTTHSGMTLLLPSRTTLDEEDSLSDFLKLDGFLNEILPSVTFSVSSVVSCGVFRSFSSRKKSKAARVLDLSDIWSLDTSDRSYFLYFLGFTTWSGTLLGPRGRFRSFQSRGGGRRNSESDLDGGHPDSLGDL